MISRPEMVDPTRRVRTIIRGAVQGVGFRPFVFRLAKDLSLKGWVNNSSQGVCIEVEGENSRLQEFLRRLDPQKPPRSFIQSLESTWLDPVGYVDFVIHPSSDSGEKTALVMSDIGTCEDCLAEILDPSNRRYFYPFTNCTYCGPRFSIIESLPYDRANTSMKRFAMCPQCQAEYDNPLDRRFHAQPNACPICGPSLALWDPCGSELASPADLQSGYPSSVPPNWNSILGAAQAIRNGQVVAVKGLGGFHLMVRADSDQAVQNLRRRKHREEKPFAVMFPSLSSVQNACEVSSLEERLLRSPEAPIVLLHRRSPDNGGGVCVDVAPDNPNLGVLLPYTPLHHLLLAQLELPVVATSGNLSDEPICTDEHEALERLHGIADLFLVHNRPIVRHVDDSIVRVIAGRELVLRRARGFAPLPIPLPSPVPIETETPPVLAVGAHLKNSVALAVGPQVFISQHIGDLETEQAYEAFRRGTRDLQTLYAAPASRVAADLHPDYLSTRFALETGLPCTKVQHHVAHVLSCMAENELGPPVLGVSWDGTGYGLDETIWGGEFFRISPGGFERVAHFRPFRLPGGEQAIREPRRCALGLLFEALGEGVFDRSTLAPIRALSATEKTTIRSMLQRRINSPLTSSVGRLFDATASLLDLRQRVAFEGQAAMQLEFLLHDTPEREAYKFNIQNCDKAVVVDWQPCLETVLSDVAQGIPREVVAARFHNFLVECIVSIAQRIGLERVVLSGGCFQNRYLTERAVEQLLQAGLRPYWHQRVPPNDGGICLGQVVAARWWKV